jgi:hypothetical protein
VFILRVLKQLSVCDSVDYGFIHVYCRLKATTWSGPEGIERRQSRPDLPQPQESYLDSSNLRAPSFIFALPTATRTSLPLTWFAMAPKVCTFLPHLPRDFIPLTQFRHGDKSATRTVNSRRGYRSSSRRRCVYGAQYCSTCRLVPGGVHEPLERISEAFVEVSDAARSARILVDA